MNRFSALKLGFAPFVIGQETLPPVRVGSTANDDVTPVLVANEKGLFHQVGLDVSVEASSNGTAVAAAVAGGSLDIGRASILPIITAYSHGLPFTLVAPSAAYNGGRSTGGVLTLKESPFRSGRDLDGKIIAVSAINDISTLGIKTWIDNTGGVSSHVQFIEATGAALGVALDSGRIAAGTVVSPFLSQMVASGKYRLMLDPLTPLGNHLLSAVWFATTSYANTNPDVIRKFSDVVMTASAFCNDHPDQTVQTIASFAKIDPSVIRSGIRNKYDLKLTPSDIQPVIDAAARYNVIPKRFDTRDFISPFAAK